MKYSIVIPVYNVESYIRQCVESVLCQSTKDEYEIILVDDGSPDQSGEICDEFAEEHSHIHVIHSKNFGVSHARNTGIEYASGEYVLFLDADDLWEDGTFRALSEMSVSKPDVMIFGHLRLLENGERISGMRDAVIPSGESGPAFLDGLFSKGAVPRAYSVCYAVQREFLNRYEIRFREDMKVSEDFDFVLKCLSAARRVIGTEKALYVYRMRSGSATSSVTRKKFLDNIISKAEWFQKYPVPVMANLYANNAVLAARLGRNEAAKVKNILKDNRRIWDCVTEPAMIFARVLVTCFGDYRGACIYAVVRAAVRRLRHKTDL